MPFDPQTGANMSGIALLQFLFPFSDNVLYGIEIFLAFFRTSTCALYKRPIFSKTKGRNLKRKFFIIPIISANNRMDTRRNQLEYQRAKFFSGVIFYITVMNSLVGSYI